MTEQNYTLELPGSYAVHPAAEVYPMLPDDRLQELAESIKLDGMHFPIIMTTDADGEPILVDGRNRLAACGIAECHPKIEWRDFDDDDAIRRFVYAASERRDISKGQRAMAAAIIWPEGEQGKRVTSVHCTDVSQTYVNKARTILKYQPDMVEKVMRGLDPIPFSVAYTEAMAAKRVIQAGAERVNEIEDHLDWIKKVSPDLAEKLISGHIELDPAIAQAKEIEAEAKSLMTAACIQAAHANSLVGLLMHQSDRDRLRSIMADAPEMLKEHSYTTASALKTTLKTLSKKLEAFHNGE